VTAPVIRRLLVADGERRPRLVWRLLIVLVAIAAWAVPVSMVAWVTGQAHRLGLALLFVVLVPPVCLVAWLVDRRRPSELGLPVSGRHWLGVLWGSVLGAALIAGIALVEQQAGLAVYRAITPDLGPLAWTTFELALVAVHEELLFRGYLLTNVAEGLGGTGARVRGLVLATVVTALGFVVAHVGNPHASVLGMVNIGLAGVWLALPYVLRGELGVSIGLHFGWNLAQSLLGMAVSGNELGGALVDRTLTSSDELVTGGSFGAEGGVLGLGALILGTLVVGPLAWATRDPVRAAAVGLPPVRAAAVTEAAVTEAAAAP
jgi:uncharacterized protein